MATMERGKAEHGDIVFESNKPIPAVHFPLEGIVSIVVEMDDGSIAEVGTVGNEGMVGVPLLLGADGSPNKALYQVPGEGLRMSAKAFRKEVETNADFAKVMRLHAQCFLNQVSQSTGCNSLHPVLERLSRWILMCHDRTGTSRINLTQEFLAQMLGVRRASVTVVAATLQKAGYINYRRGVIDVLDRAGLEEHACECYARVRAEYERLLC